ncbi:hypothetical protein ACLKA7_017136 [Drosophila subpalustris]
MHVNSETELNANNLHIINRTSATKGSRKSGEETKDGGENQTTETETETNAQQQRISFEVEAKVNLKPDKNNKARRKSSTSPAVSIRSTTISIVSIDEDAIDSSCIDSDSEAEPDEGCTVHKLGQQVNNKYPPQSDELTQLNKGLTVISRQVMPSNGPGSGLGSNTPPDVVAQQLLNGNLNLATPTTITTPATPSQQIGSIALTNTTDVTFGDKHYYEGPVTIQQILIDSREKWKSTEGQDNPAFNPQSTEPNATGTKLDESCKAPALCPFLPHTISRKAIVITATFVAFTIILGIVLATTTNVFGKTVNKMSLKVISVADWNGRQPKGNLTKLALPVHRVIISHTAAEGCESPDICAARVRVVQNFHMDGWNWDHIGYNFLIGGDGLVYEGRGWDAQGAHTLGYNADSIGISFIGTFIKIWPTEQQLRACQLLMAEANDVDALVLVNVKGWGGRVVTEPLDKLELPVDRVIIAHTDTESCVTLEGCSYRARFIQAFHIDTRNWGQVGYNFMVGGDGRVYEGRGWDYIGAHTLGSNSISIGIAFIGNFDQMEPNKEQLQACLSLLAEGVRLKKLTPDYKVFGHLQLLSTKNKDNIGGGLVLRFVPRSVWLAQPPQKQLPALSLPVPMVILLPTNSENCSTQAACVFRVRFLQTFNIESEHRDDITFNFLIGGDGNVYVGRGWDIVGAHMHGYNTRSVSFAYIGTFQHQKPSSKQLNVTRLLLEDGVNHGKIAPDYKLYGASTLEPTLTEYNADRLYESFANWTHWTT